MAGPDRVQPIKWESPDDGGTQLNDVPTQVNPNEDGLDSRGLYIQDDTSKDSDVLVSRDNSGNMTFKDKAVVGTVTLASLAAGGGMSEEMHRELRQLTHEIDDSYFEEYSYSGLNLAGITVWDSPSKIMMVRSYAYTYSGSRVTQEVVRQYDESGNLKETLTYTYVYSGVRLSSVQCVRTT